VEAIPERRKTVNLSPCRKEESKEKGKDKERLVNHVVKV